MVGLLWFIVVLLVVAWFFGFAVNVGWWSHVLLVLALLGVLYQLFVRPILATTGRTDRVVHTDEPRTHTHTHVDRVEHVHRDDEI